MTDIQDYSILAPVPLEHLLSGAEIASNAGFIAFGSRKWELFRKVDELRGGAPVPVLIYPSHEDLPAKDSLIVSWVGWYVGCEESSNGKHSMGMTHRPPTTGRYTSDNRGHWAVFWHVRDLHELPATQRLPISAIQTVKGGWRKSAPPRGPELVATPSTLELLL
ncbi:hypothetical protein SAMN05216330_10719 [Bradyrhizobium sp. Ghvi]|uniref:hypothetical protein n=1 Tax=Bradyrhizobium sp. Ghvi TaxID=1855319 RepID=UPI0008DFA2CB|nr:hypothetical protein [Bradyrhizobium sp. Ghvi]SFP37201.1 hypothetical protein SAMN05216330_10719 [Bradyrhizobium sp. Ghvi]